jgi:hypothetical protein
VCSPVRSDFNSLDDARPVYPFEPPSRFHLVETKPLLIGKRFDPAGLEGKQIIYISAPARISIKELGKMSWKKIQQGTEVFDYEEETYSLTMDENTSRKALRVLLPTKEGYKPGMLRSLYAQSFR